MNPQIEHNFTYHPPTGSSVVDHERVRAKAREFALLIDEVMPARAGREKAIAIAKAEEAMMWANAGLARHSEPPVTGDYSR
jgi:hypothetical protein